MEFVSPRPLLAPNSYSQEPLGCKFCSKVDQIDLIKTVLMGIDYFYLYVHPSNTDRSMLLLFIILMTSLRSMLFALLQKPILSIF